MAEYIIQTDKSVLLNTEGTYCDRNIRVNFTGDPSSTVSYQSKAVTPTKAEQIVTPDTGYDALSQVVVEAIPDSYIIPSGSLAISENGVYDVKDKASVSVDVSGSSNEVVLEELNVTANGTYIPVSGVDGYNKVVVNIATGGASLSTFCNELPVVHTYVTSYNIVAKNGGSLKVIDLGSGLVSTYTSIDNTTIENSNGYFVYAPNDVVVFEEYGTPYVYSCMACSFDTDGYPVFRGNAYSSSSASGVAIEYVIGASIASGSDCYVMAPSSELYQALLNTYSTVIFKLANGYDVTMQYTRDDYGADAVMLTYNGVTATSGTSANVLTGIAGQTITNVELTDFYPGSGETEEYVLTQAIVNLQRLFSTTNS